MDELESGSARSSNALTTTNGSAPEAAIAAMVAGEVDAARAYAEAATSAATQRAYDSDWRIFSAWCATRGFDALPADPPVVAVFLAAEADAGTKPSTLGRRAAAIGYYHRRAGHEPPQSLAGGQTIRDVLSGIRRTARAKPERKRPADRAMLVNILATIQGEEPRDVRDRALLAIGMAAALRRSELVALDLKDVQMPPEGLRLFITASKTDQSAHGATIAIPEGKIIKPKELLLRWIEFACITDGPIFRKMTPQGRISPRRMSDKGVALVVKQRAAAAGYDPDNLGGHSLRAGFLTEAARHRASIFKMQEVSRHKSVDVLAGYVRDADLFVDHAGDGFL